jgi:hypothetical protein
MRNNFANVAKGVIRQWQSGSSGTEGLKLSNLRSRNWKYSKRLIFKQLCSKTAILIAIFI